MVLTNYDKIKHCFTKKRNSMIQKTYLAGRKENKMKKELMDRIVELLEQANEKELKLLERLIRVYLTK